MTTVKLMMGDCLDRMSEIPDGSVDMVLTDPPYGMDYQSNRRTATDRFAKISNDTGLDWLEKFASECHRVLSNNSAAYVFCSWHKIDVFKRAFEAHFKLKNLVVWVKNNHGSGDLSGAYAPKHEFVLYMHKGRSLFRNGRTPDVVMADKVSGSKMVHPTEKPIPLLEKFIVNNSDAGNTIFDPFMGSGTTGVACVNTGRNFIGIELDPDYFKIAEGRINAVKA
jgi:site-specific DNA-methyltransferase (adenine-specific)